MALAGSKRAADRDDEYGEGSLAFVVTKPLDPDALRDEAVETFGWADHDPPVILIEGDFTAASADAPVYVWITPPEGADAPDARKANGVFARHEGPSDDEELMALVGAANDDEKLSPEEVEFAVRLLLKRVGRTL